MSSALATDTVQRVLDRLTHVGEVEDAAYSAHVDAREAQTGTKLYGLERAQLGVKAPQAIAPEVGRIVYALIIAARPRLIVEFGASLGYSTIHLASAIEDLGSGTIITTELIHDKAKAAAENLVAAGVLSMLEPRLAQYALVIADLSHDDPHHARYRDYVSNPGNGYLTVEIPVDAGLVASTRR